MEKFCGPSYKEQQSYRKAQYLDSIDEDDRNIDLSDVYYTAVKNTEEIYEERLRNKLSPITNLICLVEHYFTEEDEDAKQKLYNMIDKIKPWNSCNMAVEKILNIPKQ